MPAIAGAQVSLLPRARRSAAAETFLAVPAAAAETGAGPGVCPTPGP